VLAITGTAEEIAAATVLLAGSSAERGAGAGSAGEQPAAGGGR